MRSDPLPLPSAKPLLLLSIYLFNYLIIYLFKVLIFGPLGPSRFLAFVSQGGSAQPVLPRELCYSTEVTFSVFKR